MISICYYYMVEKGIRGGICHSIYRYTKANNKYMKYYDKNKESSSIQYWKVNNLYDWAIFRKPPVNDFQQTNNTSQFKKDFIKIYNEESDKGYFLEVDVQYIEILHELHRDLRFLPERMTIENLSVNYVSKLWCPCIFTPKLSSSNYSLQL